MKVLHKQQGMSGISMMIVIGLAVSFFLLALKIGPIYVDHTKVTSILSSLKNNPEVASENPDQIMSRIFKFFDINNVSGISKDNITIEIEDNGQTKVEIEYEVAQKLIGNLSVLVNFKDSVEIPKK